VLCDEGYINSYDIVNNNNIEGLNINLKYSSGKAVINKISRVSKPGKRVYSSMKSLGKYYNGLGILILSTSKGVMSDYNACLQKVGGEVLCVVY
ncbi:MAG: 30S ribosomal protein S8, partial [Rickettsiales bacterium]